MTLVLCLLWTRTIGRGAFERALGAVAGRASGPAPRRTGQRGTGEREPEGVR